MTDNHDYYDRLARQIVERIGGSSNVQRVSHCTTRLRFQLKRIPADSVREINKLPEVISVMHSGGLFQIVVGTQVEALYQSVTPLLQPSESSDIQSKIISLINTITCIFTPLLWLLSAAGILKGGLLLSINLGWLIQDSGTYRILFSSADAIFFFLPILLGYTAAKHFGTNPLFGIAIAGALVHPEINRHVNWLFSQHLAGLQTPTEYFLGLPIEYLNYANSVIPILFATWFNVRLERLIPKKIPDFLYKWLTPFLCLVITVPLTFLIIGPISTMIGQFISSGVLFLYHANPEVAGFIIGALWQVLVVFGIHWSLVPVIINNLAFNGYDIIPPLLLPAVFGQAGACLGVLLINRKNKETSYAGTAALTAMFGVTEPAIYGVTLPRKWPFIFGCFSAAIGSCIIASFQAKAYSLGMLSLFSFIQIVPPSGIDNTVVATILATLLTLVCAVILTYFLTPLLAEHTDNTNSSSIQQDTSDKETQPDRKPISDSTSKPYSQISSPLSGQVVALSMVGDPTFASEIMGQGVAIIPESGELRAPFNGKVASVFKTHHSIGLQSEDGVEMLIHIGIDTVKLKGKGFELLVEAGQEVVQGQILIQFDLQVLTTLGYDTTTPIVITNSDDYLDVIVTSSTSVSSGDPLMTLI